jgi:hypothetical protein
MGANTRGLARGLQSLGQPLGLQCERGAGWEARLRSQRVAAWARVEIQSSEPATEVSGMTID